MKPLLVITFACAMAVAVGGVVVSLTRERATEKRYVPEMEPKAPMAHSNPATKTSSVNGERATPPPVPSEKVSAAMSETVVKNLIANVRVAAAKGDEATRKILLNGLKNDAPTARRLLQEEINVASDPATKNVLNDILDDLKGEAR